MESHFATYVYSYPHKLAYRPLDPEVELGPLWQRQDRQQLFLYWHIPFCEMRCGFCNLFTAVEHQAAVMAAYLTALQLQADQLHPLISPSRVASLAIGGGTPTQLPLAQLEQLLALVNRWERWPGAPFSVETSPATAVPAKLRLLLQAGVSRVSLGVQSFLPQETEAVHRRQHPQQVEAALAAIRECGFPILNLDLMIGLPGQTRGSLVESLRQALRWSPEELYLYPLYVRPLTRLYAGGGTAAAELGLYRAARDFLESHGYTQVSLRMYRRQGGPGGGEYRCQNDPMLGLGCGARSYTRELHYSTPYAVGPQGVSRILRQFVETRDHTRARFGYRLDEDEQRRRFLLLSLLSEEGLEAGLYSERFGTAVEDDFVLQPLLEQGWVSPGPPWRLTALGRERADEVGPQFFSPRVRAALEQGARE